MVSLGRRPQEWKQLHTRPALVARGVEELERFAGLTRLLFRRAVADITLNGLAIRKGERVILCLLAANRDPDRFPNPHELSVMRPVSVTSVWVEGETHAWGRLLFAWQPLPPRWPW